MAGFWGLDDPFYNGDLVATSGGVTETGEVTRALPTTVTLDGYTFAVELSEWRSGPQDTFRDSVAAGDQPNDTLFNARGAWARYRYSFHHGAGQRLGDLDADADAFRFESSFGAEVADTKYQATLTHAMTLNRSSASSGLVLCRSADYVFLGSGADLYRTADLITWTLMTAPGGTIQAMTTDGSDLYVATSTVCKSYVGSATTPTAFATPVTGDCTNIGFLAGRLLVAKSNVLYEVAAAGTLTTIKTHFQAAFRWTALFNVGSRMFLGGFAGSRSELYTATTDGSGLLVLSQEAAPLPIGELLRAGMSFAGLAILCTSNGARFAEVTGDGTLTYGPLITEVGDVYCATVDGRFGYLGCTDAGESRVGVMKVVLDDEVGPLLPAYTHGVFQSTDAGTVSGVARLGGLTAFAVDGSGVWVESADTYAGQGEIESGRIAFGTVEPKGLLSLTVTFAPLQTDESIEASVFDENDVLIGWGAQSTLSTTTLEIDLQGEQVPFCRVQIVLLGPGTTTPTLYRWRLRGYPIAPFVLQWVLPLIAHEVTVVNAATGQQESKNMDDVMDWIEGLCGEKRFTRLRVGQRSYSVRVETFELRPVKWTADGELPQGLLVVQAIEA